MLAYFITRDGLAFSKLFCDIGGERVWAHLLGVALHATVGCVDFLSSDGKTGDCWRINSARLFIWKRLHLAEVGYGIGHETNPCGPECEKNAGEEECKFVHTATGSWEFSSRTAISAGTVPERRSDQWSQAKARAKARFAPTISKAANAASNLNG